MTLVSKIARTGPSSPLLNPSMAEVWSLSMESHASGVWRVLSGCLSSVFPLAKQIDNLRERNNVLVLTTSNVSEAIDLAFVDRADIKQ